MAEKRPPDGRKSTFCSRTPIVLAKDTLTRVRNHLDADYVVLGSFVDLGKEGGGQIRVDLRLQNARTGETIGNVLKQAQRMNSLAWFHGW